MAEFAVWQQNITYPARQDRALVSELFGEGVLDLSDGTLLVSERSAGANMSVDVAAGRCAVDGDEQADQETYLCVFDGATNLTIASADPDQARKDRVIVRVRDSAVSGTDNNPIREVLTGTVGSGSAPAVPASAISLAIVDVPAGANSITDTEITDDRSLAIVGQPIRGVAAKAHLGANYSLANNTAEVVPIDTVDHDDQGLFDSANNQFVLDRAGKWAVFAAVGYVENSTGSRDAQSYVNGTTSMVSRIAAAPNDTTGVSAANVIDVAEGTTVKLRALQTSGASLDVRGSNVFTFLAVAYLGK